MAAARMEMMMTMAMTIEHEPITRYRSDVGSPSIVLYRTRRGIVRPFVRECQAEIFPYRMYDPASG